MSMRRNIVLTPEQQELKLACFALVKAYGGQEAAGKRLGRDQRRISECCSTSTDRWLRLDEIAILEAATVGHPGHPHVTSLMAARIDSEIVPMPRGAASGRDLLKLFAAQSKETSDLAQTVLEAKSDDDEIDLLEAEAIDDAIDDVIANALAMRAEIRMIIREARQ